MPRYQKVLWGCWGIPARVRSVGRIDGYGCVSFPEVGRSCLEDARIGCRVEIIFLAIRFCNSPPSDPDHAIEVAGGSGQTCAVGWLGGY